MQREATEEDLPALRAAIAATWGARSHGRGTTVLRMLEERWALDHASVLIGFRDDAIIEAHIIRQRRPTLSLTAVCLPWALDSPDSGLLQYASTLWQREVGYEETSGWTPEWIWRHPRFSRQFERLGRRVRGEAMIGGEKQIETRATIAELLARPREAWTA